MRAAGASRYSSINPPFITCNRYRLIVLSIADQLTSPPVPLTCVAACACSPQLELEYKYVVRNADGGVSLWKPGSNYSFNLTPVAAGTKQVLPGGVAVRDAWDGSVRDVKVEVLEEGKPARPMTDAEREQNAFRESVRMHMAVVGYD